MRSFQTFFPDCSSFSFYKAIELSSVSIVLNNLNMFFSLSLNIFCLRNNNFQKPASKHCHLSSFSLHNLFYFKQATKTSAVWRNTLQLHSIECKLLKVVRQKRITIMRVGFVCQSCRSTNAVTKLT